MTKPENLLIHWALFFALLILIIFGEPLRQPEKVHAYRLVLGCTALFCLVWQFFSWRSVTGTIFDFYSVFLLAAFFFHFGQSALEVFGLLESSGGFLYNKYETLSTVKAIEYSLLCVLGLHAGALTASIGYKRFNVTPDRYLSAVRDERALRVSGLIMIGFAAMPFIYIWSVKLPLLFEGGRNISEMSFGRIFWINDLIASYMLPGLFFLLAGSRRHQIPRRFALAIILLIFLFYIAFGQRIDAIVPLIVFVIIWDRVVFKMKRPILLGLSALSIFIGIPMVRYLRGGWDGGFERFLSAHLSAEATTGPFSESLREFGRTIRTVIWTQNWVPEIREYEWGITYVKGLSAIVPNFFGGSHWAVDGGSPIRWLKEIMPEVGHGFGYSFIAESYLNFGMFGVFVIFFFGILVGGLALFSYRSILGLSVASSVFALSFIFVRGEALQFFRPLIWYGLLPGLMALSIKNGFTKVIRSEGAQSAS